MFNLSVYRRIGVLSATIAGFAFLSGAAQAAIITIETFYTNADTSATDTVTSTATVDTAGLTGAGTERINLSSFVFQFTKRTFSQSPNIALSAPDSNGDFAHGAFLAQFTDGVFDFLISQDNGGGFAAAPAELKPGDGFARAVWVAHRDDGITERIGLTSSARTFYDLASQTVTGQDPNPPGDDIPAPPTILLFAFGLAGLGALRRLV